MPGTDPAHTVEALFAPLRPDEQRLALALFRLLARGRPVAPDALAPAADASPDVAAAWLERVDGLQRDGAGHLIGFRGLSLAETPHRLETGAATVFGWCAWDTLFLPRLIDCAAAVSSRCPQTGEPVELQVGPEGVRRAPEGLRLSFVEPTAAALRTDIRGSFCGRVHLFASAGAAQAWAARHPGTALLGLEQAQELARHHNRVHYGNALAATAPGAGKAARKG